MSFIQFIQSRDSTPVYILLSAIQVVSESKEFGPEFSTVTCLDSLTIEVAGKPEEISNQIDKNRS